MAQFIPLSRREAEVANLLLEGKSNKLIAAALGISDRTVEFHLKNIYAKYQVSSRVELILTLGNPTGPAETRNLGHSTVEDPRESAENRDRPDSRRDRVTTFKDGVPINGEELEMKNLLTAKHVLVGVISALFTGFVWVGLFRRFGHMPLEDVRAWIAPMILVWVITGWAVGLIGKRSGSSLLKTGASTLIGMGLSPVAILPLMGFVVLPIGKFIEWIGLADWSSISRETATTLAITAMLAIWLVLGIIIGSALSYVTIKKPGQTGSQLPAPEQLQ